MARMRYIKPGFFDNDVLGDLPPLNRLLFIGLWCLADREGRLEDRPRKIKKALMGYDDVSSDQVNDMLQTLHNAGFIFRYQIDGGHYIQVVNFNKHQHPHVNEKESDIPPPSDGNSERTMQASCLHDTSTVQAPEQSALTLDTRHLTLDDTPYSPPKGGDTNSEKQQPGESLTVEMADGTGSEKPVHHSTTLAAKRFEEFWSAYPRKVGKKAAERSFTRIRPNAELFARMLSAVKSAEHSEQWRRDNGQYIPNPATWLNQGRWDDEYSTPPPPDQSSKYDDDDDFLGG